VCGGRILLGNNTGGEAVMLRPIRFQYVGVWGVYCLPLCYIVCLIFGGPVARKVRRGGLYRVLMRKPEGKRPLGRPRRSWEDNMKMYLQEVGCRSMDWIELAQDRQVAGTCECGNEPPGFIKCGGFLD
jgi:hypothetical protein